MGRAERGHLWCVAIVCIYNGHDPPCPSHLLLSESGSPATHDFGVLRLSRWEYYPGIVLAPHKNEFVTLFTLAVVPRIVGDKSLGSIIIGYVFRQLH